MKKIATRNVRLLLKQLVLIVWLVLSSTICASPKNGYELKNVFFGVQEDIRNNVSIMVKTQQDALGDLDAQKIQQFILATPELIKKAVTPYGYFKAEIKTYVTQDKNRWTAKYYIYLGPILKISTLNFQITGEGSKDLTFLRALQEFPIKIGEPFNTEKYNAAKKFVFDMAFNNGYLSGIFSTKKIEVDLKKYTSIITLQFDTGPKYYFGPVNFVNPPFRTSFLQKFLTFAPNQVYSNSKLDAFQTDLNNSNYFQQVLVTPKPDPVTRQVPIEVELMLRKAKQYLFGIGYGSDTKARFLLGLELRHLNDLGHVFSGWTKISRGQSEVEAHYLVPGKIPARQQIDFGISGKALKQDQGSGNNLRFTIAHITNFRNWQQTLSLGYQYERYELFGLPKRTSKMIIPKADWLRNTMDDPLKPTSGYKVELAIQGTNKAIMGGTSFSQVQLNSKYLKTFWRITQIILRLNFGYTNVSDIDSLPLSLQFYVGGMQNLRGYGYKEIGPGKYLSAGSVEVREKVIGDFYGTAFLDFGNVSDRLEISEFKKGAGVGVLWYSPIGPFSISVAQALSVPRRPIRFQFSIGPEF
jgi:translocation and assembly module TamA